jgi:hypothetical protein
MASQTKHCQVGLFGFLGIRRQGCPEFLQALMQGFDLGQIAAGRGPVVLACPEPELLEEIRRLFVLLGDLQGGGLGPAQPLQGSL